MDDIKDIEMDMRRGTPSAVYVCLPEKLKSFWDIHTVEESEVLNGRTSLILNYVMENDVIERLRRRICMEMEKAASFADACHLPRLAEEFRCLIAPIRTV